MLSLDTNFKCLLKDFALPFLSHIWTWGFLNSKDSLPHYDVFGLEMWTSEDSAPELGHSSCILTFRKHARNVTFGNVENERHDIKMYRRLICDVNSDIKP